MAELLCDKIRDTLEVITGWLLSRFKSDVSYCYSNNPIAPCHQPRSGCHRIAMDDAASVGPGIDPPVKLRVIQGDFQIHLLPQEFRTRDRVFRGLLEFAPR